MEQETQTPPPPPTQPPLRDLSRGMSGADVTALHNLLIPLGYTIADKELSTNFFGDTTHKAVVDFQKKVRLVPNGIFDGKASWLMNDDREHPVKFIVIGQVIQANGLPLEGASVKAFDKDLRSEQQLGKTDTTRKNGEYVIFYMADDFLRVEKDRADLIVRVFNSSGTLLDSSAIIFNAGKVEVLNFMLGGARANSEFNNIVREITPLLDGVAQPQLTADDVAFLSGETGIDPDLLTLLAESARRNQEAPTVAQSTFYGLFRQSLPTTLVELLENELSVLRSSLESSSNDAIIPQLSSTELDQIVEQLRILKGTILLQPAGPGEPGSLGELLRTSQLTVDKQRIVAELVAQFGGTTEPFWQALNDSTSLSGLEKNHARFTLKVGQLTTNHIPLVKDLQSFAPTSLTQKTLVSTTTLSEDATALRPFAGRSVADWKQNLEKRVPPNNEQIGAPAATPGATPPEKIDNYAVALAKYIEKALPTPVIAARVDKDVSSDNPFLQVKADLKTFFLNNPSYEFRSTPIDVYLSEDPDGKLSGVSNRVALVAELKNMQRLFNIAPRYEEMRSLRKDDLHSAVSMVKVGERRFIEKYAAVLGGEEKAEEVYRKAKQTHATALNFYLTYAPAASSSAPFVIPNGNEQSSIAPKITATTLTTSVSPDLPTLFGSLDVCDCEQCKSVYSPAAYFVDIMRFLNDGPTKGGFNPLQILLKRRPDLEHIELTCENTSTEVPYVDLARELLEADVTARDFDITVSNISNVLTALNAETVPTGFTALFVGKAYSLTTDKASVRKDGSNSWLILDSSWAFKLTYPGSGNILKVTAWPQTSWTTDELRANPEHVHGDAYAKLRSAVYPWNLPLNLPAEESRVYLGHFGVKRHEVMETFLRGGPSAVLAEKSIAFEYLGATKEEADIITGVTTGGDTAPSGAWDFWGLKETGNDIPDPTDGSAGHATGPWYSVLKRVSIFLQQSGLAYRELLEVLSSYFINPATPGGGRTFGIASTDTSNPATCKLSKLEIQVIDSRISDKDAALAAAWKRIHRFVRLARRLGWSMRDLDKTLVALPNPSGTHDITEAFLRQLSHIQRLRAQFGLPVVNLISFWADIDTGRYLDHFSEGEPAIPSLYAVLFNNRNATGQSLSEDPANLTGTLSGNLAIIAAALQVSVDDLSLLLADPNVVANDTLSLANLSALYRHATFARALQFPIRTYLSALKLISSDPFLTTTDTVKFTQQVERIIASGFSVEDLSYLLRHDFPATSPIAISDQAIANVLTTIRNDLRKVAAENSFVAVSTAANPATNDPNGDLTKRKLALLNWDTAVIEQLIAVLNGTFVHQTELASLKPAIPESLASKVTYDSIAGQLRFRGIMTGAEKVELLALQNVDQPFTTAVNALYNAPRTIVGRHMRRFSVPQFAADLAELPPTFPDALKDKVYYNSVDEELNFVGVMTEAERKILLALSANAAYKTAIESLYSQPDTTTPDADDVFITSADVAALFDTDPAITPAARFLLILEEVLPYLRATLSERIVIQRVGEYLQFEAKAANQLLTTWVDSPVHDGQKAIEEFLAPAFAESNPNVEITREAFSDQFKTFTLLYKIAAMNIRFELTAQQFQWLFDFRNGTGWLDLNTLPVDNATTVDNRYDGWARLADLFRLRDRLPLGETLLTDVFTAARNTTDVNALLQQISNATGWKLENLTALNGTNGFNFQVTDYEDEEALARLHAAFAVLQQLGASADQCLSWTKANPTEDDERTAAQDAKALVRARLDSPQWLEKAKALNDPLREMQRDALVSYLMLKHKARNASELYDDFLIDVEMSPCMMTTRIKQAISSVQLFVQRSLMNLESDVAMTPSEAKQWAQWRKQYRMWEANRKVLLYPENWIEPELRDDKSSIYKDLENELQQSDVTMDSAETAFQHYLEKLHEVARLEIVGMYEQKEAANGNTPATDVMHVIGRTFSAPHIHYYRRQIDSAYWTPWEKIDADIQGNHVIPVVWNRRLYVFWPVFTTKLVDISSNTSTSSDPAEPASKTLEVKLAWSEYRNGKWSPKKLANSFVSELRHPEKPLTDTDYSLFSFKTREQTTPVGDQQIFIDCYGPLEILKTVTVPPAGTPNVAEKHLFYLGAGKTKSITATVNGSVFLQSDVSKVEIIARPSSGPDVKLRLSNDGTLDVTNRTQSTINYLVSSSDYRAENIVVTGQKQFCWLEGGDTERPIVGGNGDRALPELIGSASTTLAMIGVEATIEPTIIPRNGERLVCDIITEAVCDFNLVPIELTGETKTITSVDPNQAIASFLFDDGQQSVSPILSSTQVTTLEPMAGTLFENMMMVEYQNSSDGMGEPRLLQRTPGTFRLLGRHQTYDAKRLLPPYFFQDDFRTYFLFNGTGGKVRFVPFFHPKLRTFFKSLNRSGISGLLTLANQQLTDKPVDIDPPAGFNNYQADSQTVEFGQNFALMPKEDVDFGYSGAYSIYNWELFFHAPFMIATQLSKNQRFEEAQKWFHYIFDPTATDSPANPSSPGPERFWRVKPLYDEARRGTQTLEDLFSNATQLKAQVNEWIANPFKPHVIARLRLVTYMKAIVMRYVDNLIAWGDQLFRRDTIESVNEATQLYILAAQILGRRPEQIPARAKEKVQTYRTLDDKAALNGLSNAMVQIEGFLSPSVAPVPDGGLPLMPFFGVPGNEKLLGYWNTVADRLFKIRHCQNIDGVVRSLPTFEPPIDPGLLVKAASAGVDIASALSDINVGLPNYRFNVMQQKATELVAEVRNLGSALLVALEKRDAEALSLLRASHEIKVLNAVRTIREKQLGDAKEMVAGLARSKEMITLRRDYYRDIAFMNNWELSHMIQAGIGLVVQDVEIKTRALAATLHLFPETKIALPPSSGFTFGGGHLGSALEGYAGSLGSVASFINNGASLASTMGGYQRRFDDWKLQERLANKELEQIDSQIAAANIRVAIAEKELRNHDLQIENTREIDEFMRSKFTNRELYDWMVGQISGIYFQSYQLAYDVAKRAERAYRYELGLRDSSFIQFGYWDSLKKGLLAGERLAHDLKRMEVSYLDQNKREYEIVKHISLQAIDPVSLVKLKQTGECFVSLPEALFDVDYAGHYMRRIKSVGITVPCVTGPYTGVNCTLTLQSSTIRHGNTLLNDKYARQSDDPRFVDSAGAVQSIVTSGAQNDSGMFETNLRDERYLPFEGQGAISTWRLELPRNFKTFDYNTISDVVLHVRYTAREGGSVLRMQAEQELQTALNEFIRIEGKRGLAQMFSLRHDFPTEWSRFLNPVSGAVKSLTMGLGQDRFPFLFQGRTISIKTIELYVKVKPGNDDHNSSTIKLTLAPGLTAPGPGNPSAVLQLDSWNSLVRGSKPFSELPGPFTLNAWLNDDDPVNPNAIQDIIVVCRYTCS